MQSTAFVIHAETVSEADRRVLDRHAAEVFTTVLAMIDAAARRFRPNRRAARPTAIARSGRGLRVTPS